MYNLVDTYLCLRLDADHRERLARNAHIVRLAREARRNRHRRWRRHRRRHPDGT